MFRVHQIVNRVISFQRDVLSTDVILAFRTIHQANHLNLNLPSLYVMVKSN